MSNNEMIKVTVSNGMQAVNARDLHAVLGVGRDFSNWIRSRIKKFGFVENVDYQSFAQIGEREIGATVRIDYALSLNMAKELAMIENNEKGRQVRRYFIECEEKLKSQQLIPQNYPDALRALADKVDENRRQQKLIEQKDKELDYKDHLITHANLEIKETQRNLSEHRRALFSERRENEELKKKVSYLDIIMGSDSLVTTTQIAKDYGMAAAAFNKLLNKFGIQYKVGTQWVLYAKYMYLGYTESVTFTYGRALNKKTKVSRTTKWTQKGIKFLYDTLKDGGIIPLVEQGVTSDNQ